MTDRELLELAARSIGVEGVFDENTGDIWRGTGSISWNSLKYDGDTLRLAMKLNIEFAFFDDMEQVNAGVWSPRPESWDCMTPYNGDKHAATRRAITRAAAAIQLSKEGK